MRVMIIPLSQKYFWFSGRDEALKEHSEVFLAYLERRPAGPVLISWLPCSSVYNFGITGRKANRDLFGRVGPLRAIREETRVTTPLGVAGRLELAGQAWVSAGRRPRVRVCACGQRAG